jgi:hypothetical protein
MYFFGQDKLKDCLFNPSVYSSFSVICEIFWLEFEGKGDLHDNTLAKKGCEERGLNVVKL